ncbi:uncharacterized protein M6G45_013918 [Spheniscus humboldti]
MRRECHRNGGITEARFKFYSKGTQVLCLTHITTTTGGSSQTKISSQNTFLEELGLAIWQRAFDKKSCKMLLLRTTCSLTHCLDCCTIIAGLELSEFWGLLNCI